MATKVILESSADDGFQVDDVAGRRPWPIASTSAGWALLTPSRNYRVTGAGVVTAEDHTDRVDRFGEVSTINRGGRIPTRRAPDDRIRPVVAPLQVAGGRIVGLFPVATSTGRIRFVYISQFALTPAAALAQDNAGYSGETLTVVAHNRGLGFRHDELLLTIPTANWSSNTLSAARFNQIAAYLDGFYSLASYWPRLDNLSVAANSSADVVMAQPWVNAYPWRESGGQRRRRFVALTAAGVRSDVAITTALASIPSGPTAAQVPKCDVIADPARSDGTQAFALHIRDGKARIERATGLRSSMTTTTLAAEKALPVGKTTFAAWDNLYIAANSAYLFVVLVNRTISGGKPDVQVAGYDRATGVWSEWADMIPDADWQAGDGVAHQVAVSRVPHSKSVAVAVTRTRAGANQNVTYLYHHEAAPTPPAPPTVTVPSQDGAAVDVSMPLTISWHYSDPNARPQGHYRVRRRIGAVDTYWDGSAWVSSAAAGKVAGTATSITVPANWATAGSTAWDVAVTVWNDLGTPSAEGPARRFRPAGPATVAITAPAAGAALISRSITVTWTTTSQRCYELTAVGPGGATAEAPLCDSESARTATIVVPDIGAWTITLDVESATGFHTIETVAVTVGHDPALSIPTCAVAVDGTALKVTAGNFDTAAEYWQVRRRASGTTGVGLLLWGARSLSTIREGPADPFEYADRTAQSGVGYEYQTVIGTADNRSQASAWTA